jgi:hypothetical protein
MVGAAEALRRAATARLKIGLAPKTNHRTDVDDKDAA